MKNENLVLNNFQNVLFCYVQDKKNREWARNPGFFQTGRPPNRRKKPGFFSTVIFLSCTQVILYKRS